MGFYFNFFSVSNKSMNKFSILHIPNKKRAAHKNIYYTVLAYYFL